MQSFISITLVILYVQSLKVSSTIPISWSILFAKKKILHKKTYFCKSLFFYGFFRGIDIGCNSYISFDFGIELDFVPQTIIQKWIIKKRCIISTTNTMYCQLWSLETRHIIFWRLYVTENTSNTNKWKLFFLFDQKFRQNFLY
jgi:hypothetical protein